MEESFEMVPRDPLETENREAHAPALAGSTQSWADETSAAAESAELPTSSGVANVNGDGFQEVTANHRGGRGHRGSGGAPRGQRGGPRGGGEFRGERRRGGGEGFRGGRGRGGEGGFRGEGRGRGGPRGGRGGPRGESS
jgi:hypothetical protein